jgi:hypothetical protein
MNTEIFYAVRETSGRFKVDASRGTNVDRLSSEWFSRPENPAPTIRISGVSGSGMGSLLR